MPTLAADHTLLECLRSLELQTLGDFEVIVIDNSGRGLVTASHPRVRVIANQQNVGFGAAVNQAFRASKAPFLATLNDDAAADPRWLETLMEVADRDPGVGMVAAQVRLAGTGRLDSAGMLLASDGSSKQSGHGQPAEAGGSPREALFPSGSAALYRRTMLEEIGLFDERYFLYCEDTDLGLRAIWAGWKCLYAPEARVEHRYSHSAGRASPLKAFYVERNRLFTVLKCFPASMLWAVPPASAVRYLWHLLEMLGGRGKGAEFRAAGHSSLLLPWLVLRAHVSALLRAPELWSERKRIHKRIHPDEFAALVRKHSISLREVAAQ